MLHYSLGKWRAIRDESGPKGGNGRAEYSGNLSVYYFRSFCKGRQYVYLRGSFPGNLTGMVDTTAESVLGALKLENLNLSMLCASGSWRFLHLVTDDYSGNKKMRKLLDAELMQRERLIARFPSYFGTQNLGDSLSSLTYFTVRRIVLHRAVKVSTRFPFITRATCLRWQLSTFLDSFGGGGEVYSKLRYKTYSGY